MARTQMAPDFERLVEEHHREVWLSARRVLRADDDAQDVTQEVFLRVLDGRLRLEGESDPRRVLCWWSIRIALNTKRGARRRREREDRHAMEIEHTSEEGGEDRRLWGFVEQLPSDLRVPVVLRFAEGYGFADIGQAVGIAESTAHERVQRGLARLREVLGRGGFAVMALDLESRIGRAAPSTAPEGLVRSLLDLPRAGVASTAALGSTGFLAAVAAGALAVGAAAYYLVGTGGGPSEPPDASAVSAGLASGSDVTLAAAANAGETADARRAVIEVSDGPTVRVDSASGADAADHRGEVRGRIVDVDGAALTDCEVAIVSVERSGKLHAYCAKAKTDANGRFHASVEVADAGGGHYTVQAVHKGYAIQHSQSKLVRPDVETDFGDLAAAAGTGLGEGRFGLDLEVVGPDGRPVVGADVRLASTVPLPVLAGSTWSEWLNVGDRLERADGRATTDVSGLAHIDGEMLGGKALRVMPPDEALAPKLVRFDVTAGTTTRLFVVLDVGRSISGRIRVLGEVMSEELAVSLRAHIVQPTTGKWEFAEIDPDGSFLFAGLPGGVHRVQVSTDAWRGDAPLRLSPGWLDIDAGTVGVDIALKREDDPRDIGVHGAEVHGRIVRAEDGAPQAISWWGVDVDPVRLDEGADVERDWLPNHIFPRPVQRAAAGAIPEDASVFHRTGLAGGKVLLRCAAQDRAMFVHGPIDLGEREIVGDLVLELQPAGSIEGLVKGPDGRTLDGAFVFLTGVGPISDRYVATAEQGYREADGRGFFFVNGTGKRAKNGRFELGAIPPATTFRLAAVHPKHGKALGRLVTLTPGQVLADLEIQF